MKELLILAAPFALAATVTQTKQRSQIRLPTLSGQVKIALLGAAFGCSILGFLARYLRRRKGGGASNVDSKTINYSWRRRRALGSVQNQKGSDVRCSVNLAVQRFGHRQGLVSLSSDRHSVASTKSSTITGTAPQQLGVMGIKALETEIGYWEDAGPIVMPARNGKSIIPDANKSCGADITGCLDSERRTMTSISSEESFVSAQADIANLGEFEEFGDLNLEMQNLALYQLGLSQLEEGGVPFRSLRTEWLGCLTDSEYLAKLHCIRLAFQLLLKDADVKRFFTDSGKHLIMDMLVKAAKDPKDLLIAFDEIIEFVNEDNNWPKIEKELNGRGVKCMTFYDIVFDYIILKAFDDLEKLPSSVVSVIQSRWLSNSVKEMALSTTVWSVLQTKRRILKYQDGFISHFYAISEHLSPVLAWGFLGPENDINEMCHFFKEQVLGFLNDIYNFNRVRYTSVEDLSQDVFELAKLRLERVYQRISL